MKRRILDFMMTACCMVFSFLALVACDNELDIRQEYPFTVESMPVADEIVNGETVEIRLEIKPEGNFSGTVYTLRYFQPDGKGSLKMDRRNWLLRMIAGKQRPALYCMTPYSQVKNMMPGWSWTAGTGTGTRILPGRKPFW